MNKVSETGESARDAWIARLIDDMEKGIERPRFVEGDYVKVQPSGRLARVRKALRSKKPGVRSTQAIYWLRLLSGYTRVPGEQWKGMSLEPATKEEFDAAVDSLIEKCNALKPGRLFKPRYTLKEEQDDRVTYRVRVGPFSLLLKNRNLPMEVPIDSDGTLAQPSLLTQVGWFCRSAPSGACFVVAGDAFPSVVQIDYAEPCASSLFVARYECDEQKGLLD